MMRLCVGAVVALATGNALLAADYPDRPVRVIVTFPAGGGTDIVAVHDALPPAVSPADNELGWRMSLGKLAALVERGA